MIRLLLVILVSLIASSVAAHEVRPGYIEIVETKRDYYDITWKQPVRPRGNQIAGLGLRPIFPTNCTRVRDSQFIPRPGALLENFTLQCVGGLPGQIIGVEGLQKTITDVFVRLELLDGGQITLRLTATHPAQKITGGGLVLQSYFTLGVRHLLGGADHILFVLGLVLLVVSWRRLFWVITAFTLAHSLTLALSILDVFRLPSAPVEAMIALSILFVAVELTRSPSARSPIAERFPQVIAFGFGLLHGFGFAGVLYEIGLPRAATISALALFNIGLEVGQLMLVAAFLLIRYSPGLFMRARTDSRTSPSFAVSDILIEQGIPLILGAAACYWLAMRLGLMLGFM